MAKIVNSDHQVIFKRDSAKVRDSKKNLKLSIGRLGDLFCIEGKSESCALAEPVDFNEWHRRLGHLNMDDLSAMIRNKDVKGLYCRFTKQWKAQKRPSVHHRRLTVLKCLFSLKRRPRGSSTPEAYPGYLLVILKLQKLKKFGFQTRERSGYPGT